MADWKLRGREIVEVLRSGRAKSSQFFILKFLPSPDDSRFAIIVGRKLGCVVERNKLKRRLREILRNRLQRQGWRVVLLVKDNSNPKATELSFPQLEVGVVHLLLRAGMLDQPHLNERGKTKAEVLQK